jgi:hypothetical protein
MNALPAFSQLLNMGVLFHGTPKRVWLDFTDECMHE